MPSRDTLRRIEQLEQAKGTEKVARVRRIIMVPGNSGPEQLPVLGWRGGSIETLREPGESEEACWERHNVALDAAHGKSAVILNAQITDKAEA